MTGLLEIKASVDSEIVSTFFDVYDNDKDKKLTFSDFSKAFLPFNKNDANNILIR